MGEHSVVTEKHDNFLAEQTINIRPTPQQPSQSVSLSQAMNLLQHSLQIRKLSQVEFVARQIIDAYPALSQAYDALSTVLLYEGRYSELEKFCAACIQHCPQHVPAYINLSTALRSHQRHESAQQALNAALHIEPNNTTVLNYLATLHKECGELKQALITFNRVIEIDSTFCEAYWNRADLYKAITIAELINMEQLAANSELSNHEKAYFYYAIAAGYEHNNEFSKSFTYLQQGARFKHISLKGNHSDDLAAMARIPKIFNSKIFTDSTANNKSTAPIFICGLPRSGTTLIEHIISSHSEVTAGDELFELARATENYLRENSINAPYPDWVPNLTTESWRTIGQDYLKLTKHLQDTPYFTDKMPLNYKALGIIRLALPNAKIINCMRQPLDNLFGCYKQLFGDGLQFTYDLDELADTYIAYRNVMAHWHQSFPGKILDVHYEDLIQDQEGQTRRILEFLDLDWSEECLNFHRNPRIVHTVSNSQIRKPLFSSSVGRWRNYEKELAPLRKRLKPYL